MLFLTRYLLLIAACFSGALVAKAENWPSWRGPSENNISQEKNIPLTWSQTENVAWHVSLPDRGNSSPIIWQNKIFITQAIEKDNFRGLFCFDLKTGRQLWQKGVIYKESEPTHEANPYCAASPVTDGKVVIAHFGTPGMYAYDLEGNELWHTELGPVTHVWGYASSPILYRDLCVVYQGPGTNSHLAAFHKSTGKKAWDVPLAEMSSKDRVDGFAGNPHGIMGSFSTPMTVDIGKRTELIFSFTEDLISFDPTSGKEYWRCKGLNPLIYTSPTFDDGILVTFGGYFGGAMAVKPGGSGDVTATHRLWQEPRLKKNFIGAGVIKDGFYYILSGEGFVRCVEVKTGKLVYEERLKGQGAKSDSWSAMVLNGDRIYVPNQSGETFVLKAAPKFEVLGINSIPEFTNSTLAMGQGAVILRTYKQLWCLRDSSQ
ncbi:MAG: Serine/threonine protein kinase [Verrucomicrobiales bacterium]|nr:Serine/threonine protein kinase [Verrucomicrobiales bacterium]